MAIGRNINGQPTNFKAVAITAGFILSIAFPNSKLPPMAKSAKGVVIFAKLFTVLSSIGGNFIFNAEKARSRACRIRHDRADRQAEGQARRRSAGYP